MQRRFPCTIFAAAGILAAMSSTPVLADQTVEAGQTLTLKEDLVLTGTDSLDIKGTSDRRRNDVPRGGGVDDQTDPKFAGPIPKEFPFADDDIKSRKVTVSKILAYYRMVYSPAEGSPLIGAGDPADGKNTNIGAIGSEKEPDGFGRFGHPKK